MKLKWWTICFWLCLSACASYSQQTAIIKAKFEEGDFERAKLELDKSVIKDQQRNLVLFLLEQGSILERLGDSKTARKSWLEASKRVDELYTLSISEQATSFIYNDSVQSYAGEDYEKVAIHTKLALSFLDEKEPSKALVEARRINTRLAELNSAYEDKKNRYGSDAFALYLSAMIYESQNELDSAIIDYKRALGVYENSYEKYFSMSPPGDLISALYRCLKARDRNTEAERLAKSYPRQVKLLAPLGKTAELIVIHELDTIAGKENEEFVFGFGKEIVRFSFPIIKARSSNRFARTGVRRYPAGGFVSAQLAQNMDYIAAQTLEDRRLRMIAKQSARLIAKAQLSQKIEKEYGPLAGLVARITAAVTETGDTRSWSLFPSAFYITRYQLPAGEHTVEIYSDGRLSRIEKLSLRAGQIKFIRDFNIKNSVKSPKA